MTRDEVVRGLESLAIAAEVAKETINGVSVAQLAHDAIDLLKSREPVKPIVDIDTWKCGNCGHTLEHQEMLGDNVLFHEDYDYCPQCGKPVKWK